MIGKITNFHQPAFKSVYTNVNREELKKTEKIYLDLYIDHFEDRNERRKNKHDYYITGPYSSKGLYGEYKSIKIDIFNKNTKTTLPPEILPLTNESVID